MEVLVLNFSAYSVNVQKHLSWVSSSFSFIIFLSRSLLFKSNFVSAAPEARAANILENKDHFIQSFQKQDVDTRFDRTLLCVLVLVVCYILLWIKQVARETVPQISYTQMKYVCRNFFETKVWEPFFSWFCIFLFQASS